MHDFNPELNAKLDYFDLTFAEYAILNLIHYEQRSPAVAPQHACGLLETTPRRSTRRDFDLAISDLQRRGLIVIVNANAQREIIAYLRSHPSYGPTDGIPRLGTLDFTLRGASFYRDILNFRSLMPTDYYWCSCVSFVYRRSATLVYHVTDDVSEALRHSDLIPVSAFEPIGPWRVQWWRPIPTGFRLVCLPMLESGG